ncbi:zinc finger C3H1 domain-containing protein-like [Mytilus edulis]|uniref:zinc finger C3H1 domain-containing protein-like n=1 Tax=Mytilus edulis TaxID=6550 RepID=UPI0039F01660
MDDTKEEGELSDDDEVDAQPQNNTEKTKSYRSQYDDQARFHKQPEHYRHPVRDTRSENMRRTTHINPHYCMDYTTRSGPPPRPLRYDRIRVSPQEHPVHMSDRDRRDFKHYRERVKKSSVQNVTNTGNKIQIIDYQHRSAPNTAPNTSPGFWAKRKLRNAKIDKNSKEYKETVDKYKSELQGVEDRIKMLEHKDKINQEKQGSLKTTEIMNNIPNENSSDSKENSNRNNNSENLTEVTEVEVETENPNSLESGKVRNEESIEILNTTEEKAGDGESDEDKDVMIIEPPPPEVIVLDDDDVIEGQGQDDITEDQGQDDVTEGQSQDDVTEGQDQEDVTEDHGQDNVSLEQVAEDADSEQKVVADDEIQTEDEEDLDELELRRIALASSLSQTEKLQVQNEEAKRQKSKSKSPKKRPENRRVAAQRPARARNQSQRVINQISRRRSDERRKKKDNEEVNRRRYGDDRRDHQKRNREIQKILTIDDPKEQVRRFLLMLGDQKALDSIDLAGYRRESTKRKRVDSSEGQVAPPVLQDNYEPVEMDIDSNPDSPLDIGQGMEDLQMDQEFFNFPQQSLMMPGYYQDYIPDPSFQAYGWMDHNRQIPFLETMPVMPMEPQPPPLPPPLPSDWPPPPPPPEEPPPLPLEEFPPLPPEPYLLLPPPPPPGLPIPPPPPEEEDEVDDDEEALLRAKLLQSLANRKIRMVKAMNEDSLGATSGRSSPSTPCVQSPSSRVQSPSPRVQSPSPRVQSPSPRVQSPSPRGQSPSPSDAVKPRTVEITRIKVPIHKPIIINPNEDTTSEEDDDEEEEEQEAYEPGQDPYEASFVGLGQKIDASPLQPLQKPQFQASDFIGGLDSFLKEARRNSELQELDNRRPVDPKSVTEEIQKKIIPKPGARQIQKKIVPKTVGKEIQKNVDPKATKKLSPKPVSRDLQFVDPMQSEKTIIKQFEDDIVKQRSEIIKEQGQFKILLGNTAKFQKHMKQSQEKVDMLKEQLSKADNLLTFFKEHFEKNRKQARQFKEQVQKKMTIFKEKEKLLLAMGQRVYGVSYKPRSVVAKAGGKNRVADLSVTVVNENAAKGKENINSRSEKSNKDSLVKEKERLKKMADDYSKKIQDLKDLQAKRDQLIKESRSPVKNKAKIPRLEKIELDSNVPDDIVIRPNKRRLSLREINPSNKPNIENNGANNVSVLNKTLADNQCKGAGDITPKSSPENINQLGVLQLRKLKTLQIENVEKFLSNVDLPDLSSPSSHPLLVPQYNQISSFTEHHILSRMKSTHSSSSSPKLKYSSPLLHFKSYRFSPYYRIKEKMSLSSPTVANKINPKKMLCRFDILGTCHDEDCAGQHQSNYQMSQDEILQDIISYCPSVADIDKDTNPIHYQAEIGRYVTQVRKQYEGMFTMDRLYVLMASQVNEKGAHIKPHMMFFKQRKWKPAQKDTVANKPDFIHKGLEVDKLEWKKPLNFQDLDNVISDQDMRYFVLSDTANIQDLESSVLDSPEDEELWLKLAYKKLHDPQSQEKANLDNALNVLARGLEENKCSCDLWKHYLKLYSRHKESSDLVDLCATALQYAQHYDIWWQYMNASSSIVDKQTICDMILSFLQSQESLQPEEMSHDLLETILYKTSLHVWSGKLKTAHKFLQGKLRNTKENTWIHTNLQPVDKCVLWLSYINLKEFKQLPPQLYNPQKQMAGRIVNKDKLIIPWNSLPQLGSNVDVLKSLMLKAVEDCMTSGKTVLSIEILYVNIFNLLQSQQRYEEAASLCRKLLMMDPTMIDIWLCVAELYSTCGDPVATRQVFADALAANRFSAQLSYYAASYEIQQGDNDKALEALEMGAINYFDVDIKDKRSDPNLLYCTLLDEAVPLQYKPPDFKEGIMPESIEEEIVYVWMNYSLLLELQGDSTQAVEMYETALSKLENVKDITKIWTSYLQFHARQVLDNKTNKEAAKTFTSLVYRAVTSIPTKFDCRFVWDSHWYNYNHINTVLDLYLNSLPKELLLTEYERLITIMPSNVQLILRACHEAISQDDLQLAKSFCNAAIYDNVGHLSLWKMMISLTVKLENIREARKLYQRAVQVLPYCVTLWKDYLMFEVSHGCKEIVPQILSRCQELGLSLDEYVNFIIKVK